VSTSGRDKVGFTRDFTSALIDVEIKGVDPAEIIMFHIHCGPPGVLGPTSSDTLPVSTRVQAFHGVTEK
jgi:hypothetical protein